MSWLWLADLERLLALPDNRPLINLELIDKSKETPEVRKYLDMMGQRLTEEHERQFYNLVVYGCSHPEFYDLPPAFEAAP